MHVQLFSTFSETIAEMPPQVILKTLELQRKMLETDVALKRTLPMNEVSSILSFCRFMEIVRQGGECVPIAVPEKHFDFYRETVERLVRANILTRQATDQFDLVFCKSALRLKAVA